MMFKQKNNDSADNFIVALDVGTEFVKALIAQIDDEEIKVCRDCLKEVE